MKLRALLIWLLVVCALIPLYYLNRWLQRVLRPRENPGRLFLFFLSNFLLVIVYTLLIVGLILRLFPPGNR